MIKSKKLTFVATLATAFIGTAEGIRQTAYPDPATRGNPWTICYGHTGGVIPGQKASLSECKSLLISDLDSSAITIDNCLKSPLDIPTGRYVAILSLAHNVGASATCKSSVVRFINEGNIEKGCDSLLLYNKAAGIVFPGLTRRRQLEKQLCLQK